MTFVETNYRVLEDTIKELYRRHLNFIVNLLI